MANVKRRYDGAARRAHAEQIRTALIGAAHEVLLREGYAALSIPKLAQTCGVSAESVYKRFTGKPALVRAVVEHALRGIGPIPAETRSDALDIGDLRALLRGWGQLSAEVAPRVAPILLLVQVAASQDPALTELASELDASRRTRMTHNARRLAGSGQLPPGMSIAQASDILWTYSSPEMYDLLVRRSGWTVQEYSAFIIAGLTAQLAS